MSKLLCNGWVPISGRDYEISRELINLEDILGEGQFGDVHKGSFTDKDGERVSVAVKTCKVDSEDSRAEKFLEEACK